MDFKAIASYGAYPTAGATGAQRAAFGVSYGLLSGPLPAEIVVAFTGKKGIHPKYYGGHWYCERESDLAAV